MNDIAIRHSRVRNRFETEVEGHAAYLEYSLEGGTMAILHTIVPDEIGGRGIAGRLMQAAIDHARTEGLEIDPQCAYAEAWMRRHPEYSGLMMRSRG
jgi:predicted GNAT family acetyltransferase